MKALITQSAKQATPNGLIYRRNALVTLGCRCDWGSEPGVKDCSESCMPTDSSLDSSTSGYCAEQDARSAVMPAFEAQKRVGIPRYVGAPGPRICKKIVQVVLGVPCAEARGAHRGAHIHLESFSDGLQKGKEWSIIVLVDRVTCFNRPSCSSAQAEENLTTRSAGLEAIDNVRSSRAGARISGRGAGWVWGQGSQRNSQRTCECLSLGWSS